MFLAFSSVIEHEKASRTKKARERGERILEFYVR